MTQRKAPLSRELFLKMSMEHLSKRVEELESGLRFYADIRNYSPHTKAYTEMRVHTTMINEDQGDRARAILYGRPDDEYEIDLSPKPVMAPTDS